MKKLIISAIIASLLIPATAFGAFIDVNSSTDYNTSIQWMVENGVIQGHPDGTFKPDECVNRVEMLKMIFLANETTLLKTNINNPFTDADTNQWYWPFLKTAYQNGVVEGYTDGTFKPSQCVNRAEAIKMAMEEFNVSTFVGDGGIAFWDTNLDQWFFKYIQSAAQLNILGREHVVENINEQGYPQRYFYPGDSMTRKEVAEMLYRIKALADNSAKNYSSEISPQPIYESSEGTNYINIKYDLRFNIPNGWSIIEDTEVPQGDLTQLRVTLKPKNNGNVAISINTPPVETGYPGLIITDGFERNINGLTLQNSVLMNNDETGILISKDSYYKNESDWASHIELLFSAPSGTTFDEYLTDYNILLDSIVY